MMYVPQSMVDIVTRSERAMQRITQAIAVLSPAQLSEPRLSGGRSIKDVLAHHTWWDQWLLLTLPAERDGPATRIVLPLADQIPVAEHWANEMNAKVHSYMQPRDVLLIQAEFTTTCKHVLERIAMLSIDDLYNPEGMSATIGQPVAPLILGIYEHYEEHAHELEQLQW